MFRRRHTRMKIIFSFCFPFSTPWRINDDAKSQLVGYFYNLCFERQWEKKVTNLRPKLMKISPFLRLLSRICAFELHFTFLMCIVLLLLVVWFLASARLKVCLQVNGKWIFWEIFCWLSAEHLEWILNEKGVYTKIQLLIYILTWTRNAIICWYVCQLITL